MRRIGLSGAVVLAGFIMVASARADVDVTGTWDEHQFIPFPLVLVQSGTSLSACVSPHGTVGSGTINPTTGAFFISFTGLQLAPPYCGATLAGTAAADGSSFAATGTVFTGCIPPPFTCQCLPGNTLPVAGTRVSGASACCGNGVVEPGEACEPANGCCTSCQPTPGAACTSDGNVCTDDVCGASGLVCEHVANTAACSAGPCTAGTCAAGACANLQPAPGAPCGSDSNECTDDVCGTTLGTCDHVANTRPCAAACGNGTCASGACSITVPYLPGIPCSVNPGPCISEQCDGAGTCVASTITCANPCDQCVDGNCHFVPRSGCIAASGANIDVVVGATPARNRLRWRLDATTDAPPAGFLSPVTTTDYAFCVYTPGPSSPALLYATDAPAGAAWTVRANGSALYRDRARAQLGLSSLRLIPATSGARLRLSSNGPLLPLPSPLPTGVPVSSQLVARTGGVAQKCWQSTVTPTLSTPTRLRGRF